MAERLCINVENATIGNFVSDKNSIGSSQRVNQNGTSLDIRNMLLLNPPHMVAEMNKIRYDKGI